MNIAAKAAAANCFIVRWLGIVDFIGEQLNLMNDGKNVNPISYHAVDDSIWFQAFLEYRQNQIQGFCLLSTKNCHKGSVHFG
jgi:hypothetical protein